MTETDLKNEEKSVDLRAVRNFVQPGYSILSASKNDKPVPDNWVKINGTDQRFWYRINDPSDSQYSKYLTSPRGLCSIVYCLLCYCSRLWYEHNRVNIYKSYE